MNGCRITVWRPAVVEVGSEIRYVEPVPCGEVAVKDGLCARHLADRVRLGGAA